MSRSPAFGPGSPPSSGTAPPVLEHDGIRVMLLPRAGYEARYTPETPMIGFAFESQTGMHAFASDRVTAFRTRPNSLAYVPAGCEVMSASEHGGEYLLVRSTGDRFGMQPSGPRFNDRIVAGIPEVAAALRRMLLGGALVDTLALEAAVTALYDAVTAIHDGGTLLCRETRRITPQRLRLIDEIIQDRLDRRLTVAEIAAALDLSAGYFNRAFRQAVGTTPHDYIVAQRLSRARVLLRTTPLGLAAIAAACGFASHAHMTALFRRKFGVTPSRFRSCA